MAQAKSAAGRIAVTLRAPRVVAEMASARPNEIEPLLARYGNALDASRTAGKSVGFQVEVDPHGGTTVTPLHEVTALPSAPPDPATELAEARARGRRHAAQIVAAEEMLSADDFAASLGVSRMTVNTWRHKHQVLGLNGAKRGFRFPRWQIGADGKPLALLPQLFERLGGGPWAVYRFLVRQHPELDGLTGLEAARLGRTTDVLAVADSIADGTFA